MSHGNSAPVQILRIKAVRERVGLSQSIIYTLMAAGRFPKQVQLSTRCVGWPADEIDAWLRERITERAAPQQKHRRRSPMEAAE